jgi:pimeloyl-ACP methyl ester carboxylesterase
LTGLGERRHLLSAQTRLATHIEDVASLLFHEDLAEVVLVGHSYGGMVITGVADRAADRVGQLVYLDAAIPRHGESLTDSSPGLKAFADVREADGVRLGLWPENVAGPLYGLTDPALAEWAVPRLTPHPWKTFEDRLELGDPDAVAALPRAIVNCTATLGRRPQETRDRWFDAPWVREVDTGHDLMLTEPDMVVEMLEEIASMAQVRA